MVHSTAKSKGKRPERGGGGGGSRGKKRSGIPSRGRMPKVNEVVFDDDARREFLTGFSKRKKEKKDAAKTRALAREKQEKLDMRKQIRDARKEQAAANVQRAKEYYGDAEDPDGQDGGASGAEDDEDEFQEQAFENEEMTSRVVIEEFRMSEDEDEPSRVEAEEDEDADETMIDLDGPNANMFALIAPSRVKASLQKANGRAATKKKATASAARSIVDGLSPVAKPQTFATPNDSPEKKPAKRFTYETKAARRAESLKQKVRRMEKAESARSRSGGKTGRGAKAGGKKTGGRR